MCLALPVRVVELLPDEQALVDLGGIRKQISLALVDGVGIGDYVILHVGYALSRLDPDEAEKTLALFRAAGVGDGVAEVVDDVADELADEAASEAASEAADAGAGAPFKDLPAALSAAE